MARIKARLAEQQLRLRLPLRGKRRHHGKTLIRLRQRDLQPRGEHAVRARRGLCGNCVAVGRHYKKRGGSVLPAAFGRCGQRQHYAVFRERRILPIEIGHNALGFVQAFLDLCADGTDAVVDAPVDAVHPAGNVVHTPGQRAQPRIGKPAQTDERQQHNRKAGQKNALPPGRLPLRGLVGVQQGTQPGVRKSGPGDGRVPVRRLAGGRQRIGAAIFRGGGSPCRAAPALASLPAASPVSSSSQLTPSVAASACRLSSPGSAAPFSHLPMACRETPTRSASVSCESPAARRSSKIRS